MSTDQFHPGQVLGRYVLAHRIARSSEAEVWAARRRSSSRLAPWFALKLVPADQRQPRDMRRMLDEAELASCVQHPSVVTPLEFRRVGTHMLLAMELVPGRSFAALQRQVRSREVGLPRSIVVDLAIGVCRALVAIHSARGPDGRALRLVHRDIKPANLMLAFGGQVKVLDFGVAWAATRRARSHVGQVIGTPAYMAPEQWSASPVSVATDLFGLGAVLVELTTGVSPFSDRNPMRCAEHLANTTPAQNVAVLGTSFPALAAIVERLLARQPENRYASAAALLRVLCDLRARLPSTASPGTLLEILATHEPHAGDPAHGGEFLGTLRAADDGWREFIEAFPSMAPDDVAVLSLSMSSWDDMEATEGDLTILTQNMRVVG